MPVSNRQLAGAFQQMSDIIQITGGDSFRASAFARIARALEDHARQVADIGADLKELTAIPGVGKGTAERIIEYLNTGKIAEHEQLLATLPVGLLDLLHIPGLGPKTIALFWKQCDVTCLDDLKTMLDSGLVPEVKGIGVKKLDNLRKNLQFAQSAGARVRIGEALPIAAWFVRSLRDLKQVRQADYAGSLRRGKETIGDVDLLVAADPADAPAIMQTFVALEADAHITGQGPTKSSIRTSRGVQVDLRVVPPESYGAALLYFTGSKEHNVQLRQRAIDMERKLNEYGLYEGEQIVAGTTEEEVYKALKLAWIPPELREARDEIELAQSNKLPVLIELADIKSELHAHTKASDGKWTIRELADAAIDRGFHTIAVTDHSVSQVIANGLSAKRLEDHIVAVREVAAKLKGRITVLAGSEVDILSDGRLDYSDSLLRELDLVVASPHAALSQEPHKATARLLKAIENRYITILGHPTGRLVNRREGLSPDMKQVITAAKQRGIAMEINANHYRLDLRDAHARMALDAGVKLAINTDAHGPADLDELLYGVLTARRAGATKADVVNCLTAPALHKWIKSTRA